MFDPNPFKSDQNVENHGFSFDVVESFDWLHAIESRDVRKPYTEVRTIAVGFINGDLCVLVFTRRGSLIRVISLRKATAKEARSYVEFKA